MALDSYANLKSAVAQWLDRPDDAELIASIPDMITMTEAALNRQARHWRMTERATSTLTARYSQLPANWLETYRITIAGDQKPLRLVGVEEMQSERARCDDMSGRPTMYAHVGGELEVYPTPNQSYTMEMTYFERIPALTDNAPTNWVLEYFPDTYLYGALTHSAGFLAEDQRATQWAAFFASAVEGINRDDRARTSGSNLVMRRRMK